MQKTDLKATVEKLCKASQKDFANPYSYLQWPEKLDLNQWFMTPEFISIHGTSTYDDLSEPQAMQLSFFEAVNFFSLNIHGEKSLIEGLAHRLYLKDNQMISPYLHHFLDEENKHMVYFGGFCMKYAGKVYPDRKMTWPREEYAPGEEDFLFFAKVLIFEEIVDVYNVTMARDDRLAEIARQINFLHHKDEARHLVFGRRLVRELFDHYSPQWPEEVLAATRDYLSGYITATWSEYYNPEAYRDAGLQNPYPLREDTLANERCRKHRQQVSDGCLRFLLESNILLERPSL